jgi:hypothetical protein
MQFAKKEANLSVSGGYLRKCKTSQVFETYGKTISLTGITEKNAKNGKKTPITILRIIQEKGKLCLSFRTIFSDALVFASFLLLPTPKKHD